MSVLLNIIITSQTPDEEEKRALSQGALKFYFFLGKSLHFTSVLDSVGPLTLGYPHFILSYNPRKTVTTRTFPRV